MPIINYISPNGDVHKIDVPAGDSVMEGAIRNDVDGILAECGGACMCATCHVYVDDAFLSRLNPIEEEEREMLGSTAAERKPNSRLSCQIPVTAALEGLIVRLPPKQK